MVLQVDRHVRRGEQPAAFHRRVDQQVEYRLLDLGVARQVGQVIVDHADGDDGLAGGATLLQHRQEVQGDIRVAGQAQLARPLGMPRHQLGHRVDALGVDVAGDVAVVATDVVLLRRRAVQQTAGLQVELLDADVRRQFVAAQGVQVIQLRVVGEDPFGERLEEAPLQVAGGGGTPQGKRGIQRQLALRQGPQALVERVDQAVGLAQPEGQAHADRALDGLQQVIDCGVDRTGSAQDDALRRMGSRKFGPCLPAGRSASGKTRTADTKKPPGGGFSRHGSGVVTGRTYA